MHGTISYVELPAPDLAAAERFWTSLFGWDVSDSHIPGYRMIDTGAGQGGLSHEPAGAPRVFVTVDDLDSATERCRSLGGSVEDAVAIPSGRFARATDDQGVPFTLWEDAPSTDTTEVAR